MVERPGLSIIQQLDKLDRALEKVKEFRDVVGTPPSSWHPEWDLNQVPPDKTAQENYTLGVLRVGLAIEKIDNVTIPALTSHRERVLQQGREEIGRLVQEGYLPAYVLKNINGADLKETVSPVAGLKEPPSPDLEDQIKQWMGKNPRVFYVPFDVYHAAGYEGHPAAVNSRLILQVVKGYFNGVEPRGLKIKPEDFLVIVQEFKHALEEMQRKRKIAPEPFSKAEALGGSSLVEIYKNEKGEPLVFQGRVINVTDLKLRPVSLGLLRILFQTSKEKPISRQELCMVIESVERCSFQEALNKFNSSFYYNLTEERLAEVGLRLISIRNLVKGKKYTKVNYYLEPLEQKPVSQAVPGENVIRHDADIVRPEKPNGNGFSFTKSDTYGLAVLLQASDNREILEKYRIIISPPKLEQIMTIKTAIKIDWEEQKITVPDLEEEILPSLFEKLLLIVQAMDDAKPTTKDEVYKNRIAIRNLQKSAWAKTLLEIIDWLSPTALKSLIHELYNQYLEKSVAEVKEVSV